jgi:hypothetical protein
VPPKSAKPGTTGSEKPTGGEVVVSAASKAAGATAAGAAALHGKCKETGAYEKAGRAGLAVAGATARGVDALHRKAVETGAYSKAGEVGKRGLVAAGQGIKSLHKAARKKDDKGATAYGKIGRGIASGIKFGFSGACAVASKTYEASKPKVHSQGIVHATEAETVPCAKVVSDK